MSAKKICFIGLFDAKNDARTLNMAVALKQFNCDVTIVNTGDSITSEILSAQSIGCININVDLQRKLRYIWLEYQRETILKLKNSKFDIIVAEDVFSLGAASRLAKRTNAMLIYDSREIYSALGSLSGKDMQQYLITLKEKFYIRRVDKIIVSGDLDSEYLRKSLTDNIPYFTIMNLPYYKNKTEKNLIRENFSISNNTKIVLYQGMLMKGRGLRSTIEAVNLLDNTSLCIMGAGSYRHELQKYIDWRGLTHKAYIAEPVPYTELHDWTCSADTGVLLFEPVSISYELALPNKLFEYCMAQIPSVATDLPAIRQIVERTPISVLVSRQMNVENIAEAISKTFEQEFRNEFNKKIGDYSKLHRYETQFEIIKMIFEL
jgi:hypothetical protein